MNVARSMPYLDPTRVQRVDPYDMMSLLAATPRPCRPQTWCSYLGPWKDYRGDTALIISHQSLLSVALIPRQRLTKDGGVAYRPEQILCPLSQMKLDCKNLIIENSDKTFTFQNKRYLSCGLLLVPLADCQVSYEVLPSAHELEVFLQTGHLHPNTYERTAKWKSQQQIRGGNRVRVIQGDLTGLDGWVDSVTGNTAVVMLRSVEQQAEIPLTCLKMHFVIGDEVELLSSSWDGATGWIVAVTEGMVTVYVKGSDQQVSE